MTRKRCVVPQPLERRALVRRPSSALSERDRGEVVTRLRVRRGVVKHERCPVTAPHKSLVLCALHALIDRAMAPRSIILLLLLAAQAHAQTCHASCTADDDSLLTCRSSGDPHYVTWDGTHYDFMGSGVHRLARLRTECGCDVEVQTFTCARVPGATANVAAAIRVGATTFVITASDDTVHVGDQPIGPYPSYVRGYGTATLERVDHARWKISIAGGGYLMTAAAPMTALPTGAALQVWLALPSGASLSSDTSGLCAAQCFGMPAPGANLPPPYTWCTDSSSDRCMPIYSNENLFPPTILASLESACSVAPLSSVRDSSVPCVPQSSDCGILQHNTTYMGGIVVAGVDGGLTVPSTHPMAGQLIDSPELCLSFCEGSGPAAVYMTYRPPYTYTYTYGDDYHDPGGCGCRSIGLTGDDSHAISARACRTQCLADESQRQWTNQIGESVTGYEFGIDYSHNNVPSSTIHGVSDHVDCLALLRTEFV